MAGKGGGAWKVAYADFVTAMMAFFMVMWIVAQGKEVKEAVSGYFSDPYGSRGSRPGIGSKSLVPSVRMGPPAPSNQMIVKPLALSRGSPPLGPKRSPEERQGSGNRKSASIYVVRDGNRPNDGAVVLFQEHSAELSDRGKERLLELVAQVVGKPNKIEIRGHATRRPLPKGNKHRDAWELCYERCQNTMRFLEAEGISPDRFRLSQAGVHEPQSINSEAEMQSQNSRVEVYILSEFVENFQGTKAERAQREKLE